MDMVLDPDFSTNRYYYVFYTLGTPNRDRVSRFTATADYLGTVAGSEVVLYQDPQTAHAEHHGGALNFGNDGKLYITTGEHFDPPVAQDVDQSARQDSAHQSRTAPSPPTTRSTMGRVPTATTSGRWACAIRSGRSTTVRAGSCMSAMSAATTTPRLRKK